MPRYVYISCDYPERHLPEVEQLVRSLQTAGCVLAWAPEPGGDLYRAIETAIERCDALVAVVAGGYQASTWLNHELTYADALRRFRMQGRRPRLFGLSVNGTALPRCSEHIRIEWLASPGDVGRVLEDLPRRQ